MTRDLPAYVAIAACLLIGAGLAIHRAVSGEAMLLSDVPLGVVLIGTCATTARAWLT